MPIGQAQCVLLNTKGFDLTKKCSEYNPIVLYK